MCHVNMPKGYFERDGDSKPVMSQYIVTDDAQDKCVNPGDDFVINSGCCDIIVENADILSNLESKVSHLVRSQQNESITLLREYEYLFGDERGSTDSTCHDVVVVKAKSIK